MSISPPEVLRILNEARTNPKGFAEVVLKYKGYFDGNVLRVPGAKSGIRTMEGPKAYEEAANFLKKLKPVEALVPSKGMTKISADFLAEVQRVDPSKIGGIKIVDIIAKHGDYSGTFSRGMEMGAGTSEQVIINLLVSDGDPNRGQRKSVLNEKLKCVGVASGTHKDYRTCTVILSCTKFINTKDKDDTETFGGAFGAKTPTPVQQPPPKKEEPKKPEPVHQPPPKQPAAAPGKLDMNRFNQPHKEEPPKPQAAPGKLNVANRFQPQHKEEPPKPQAAPGRLDVNRFQPQHKEEPPKPQTAAPGKLGANRFQPQPHKEEPPKPQAAPGKLDVNRFQPQQKKEEPPKPTGAPGKLDMNRFNQPQHKEEPPKPTGAPGKLDANRFQPQQKKEESKTNSLRLRLVSSQWQKEHEGQ